MARQPEVFVRSVDLATGQMFYRFRDRKRWREFLTFLKQIRVRYPAGKLYIVCDNYGPHKKAEDYPSHAAQENAIAACPLAQQTRQAQTTLRYRLQNPPPRLPTQRCLTRH